MKELLIIGLLIVSCASKPKTKIINILDGEINSGSITLNTEDIKEDCKKECKSFPMASIEWCDCMNQCSQDVINKISFGSMDIRIYIEECPVNPTKK